ncbi:MAG: Vta1 like-domain-containing protein [Benjaminiella poitrasii]|nr:MAG: Vta1 like-domain-containing protein [Benjaminiella poitrasii]
MNIPNELKYIAPFIQRGQELTTVDPIVSYYAQYYAAKLAIARGPRTKETNLYLSHLLDLLETQKSNIESNEAITDDLVGYAHVENFALKIFLKADNEDRNGKANKNTARTFVAASVFLEILKTFGEIDPEVEAKIKYSKWKATDIVKALREGRVPTSGPPGGLEQNEEEQETTNENSEPPSISEFPSPPSNFTAPLPPSNNNIDTTSDVSLSPPVIPSVPPSVPPSVLSSTPSQPPPPSPSQAANINIASAQKNAKWAISALDYDDIQTARLQLLKALSEIGFNQENNFGY